MIAVVRELVDIYVKRYVRAFWPVLLPVIALPVVGSTGAALVALFALLGLLAMPLVGEHLLCRRARQQGIGPGDLLVNNRIKSSWPTVAFHAGLARSPVGRAHRSVDAVRRMHRTETRTYLDGSTDSDVPEILSIAHRIGQCAVTVRMLDGQTLADFAKACPALVEITEVERVQATKTGPGVARLDFIARDPLAASVNFVRADLIDLGAVAVGVNDDGSTWQIPIAETSTLISGVPGAGKSTLINTLVDQLADRPEVLIHGIDLKGGVELAPKRGLLATLATNQQDAVALLSSLECLRIQRLDQLRDAGHTAMKDLGYSAIHPLVVVIVDEIAELMTADSSAKPDRERAAEAERLLSRIVRLARASGIVAVLATQQPTTDAIPSPIRNNVNSRICFRTTTMEQAVAALGPGVRETSYPPTMIPIDNRGVCIAANQDGELRAHRAYRSESQRQVVTASRSGWVQP